MSYISKLDYSYSSNDAILTEADSGVCLGDDSKVSIVPPHPHIMIHYPLYVPSKKFIFVPL
jgi:hypothetical protein